MNKKKYIIVAEIYRKGFIIGIFHSLDEAKKKYEEISDLSSLYEFKDMANLTSDLKQYRRYDIKGEPYILGYLPLMHGSNDAFSVYILPTEMEDIETFIAKFIREREFQTELFIYD